MAPTNMRYSCWTCSYTHRARLEETEQYWRGWYDSEKNLSSPVPKLLLLAGIDRLDRKASYDTTRKILVASPVLSETILLEFSSYLSVVGEKAILLKMSDTEHVIDFQVPFLPSVEVMVKALVVIASVVSASAPDACVQLLLCSHHPCIIGTGKKIQFGRLLGSKGLLSSNYLDQEVAINSLSMLMSIISGDTYAQFESTSLISQIVLLMTHP